jgi:hypothetical protein
LVTQAQTNCRTNGGLDGIFKKVNTDMQFRADEDDVVGKWACEVTEDRIFPVSTSATTISTSSQEAGLLLNGSISSSWNSYPDSSFAHLFIWSASQGLYPTQPWYVRAAVEMNWTSNKDHGRLIRVSTRNMAAPSMDWALNQTMAQFALDGWCRVVKGHLFTLSTVMNTADLGTDPAWLSPRA